MIPVPFTVIVDPSGRETVAGPPSTEKETGNPEEAVAEGAKTSPKDFPGIRSKDMVCVAGTMVSVPAW